MRKSLTDGTTIVTVCQNTSLDWALTANVLSSTNDVLPSQHFPSLQSTFSWYPISLRDGSYSGKQSVKLIYTTFYQFVQVEDVGVSVVSYHFLQVDLSGV